MNARYLVKSCQRDKSLITILPQAMQELESRQKKVEWERREECMKSELSLRVGERLLLSKLEDVPNRITVECGTRGEHRW